MYAEFIEGADLGVVNAKLGNFIQEFTNSETSDALFAYPFDQTYLHSDFSQGRTPSGKIQYVHLFMVIAVVILLIACINFINLSTAVAGKRAREVGLRKVVGALRVQIIFQYLAESILVTLISMVTAMMLLEIFLPFFNVITQKHITVPYSSMAFMSILLAVVLLTGVLSGAYPAFHLSSFKPAGVLTRSLNPSGISARVRQGLVIAQFTISITFIVFTIVVFKQIDFVQNKNLGIRKQDIVTHELHGIKGNHAAYRSELLQVPGVRAVSFTEHNPLRTSNGSPGVAWPGKDELSTTYFSVMQVGNGFLGTFDVEIIEGRGFSESVSEGKKYFLINEKAVHLIGKSNPVGMDLKVWGQDGTVIGIVKDFHHQTLALEIEPLVIIYSPEEVFTAFIRIESDDHSTVLSRLKEVYSRHEENYTFDYTYVEEQYASDYQDVEAVSMLASLFSVAAIIISCLGLFGLSAFMAEQRTREAGIRKVLGATELKLLQLFSAEFIKLVVVSLVIAIPLALIYSNFWLASYAYRTQVGYMPFVVAGVASLFIAMLTVTYNTLHASSTNPVDSLRHE
jgi:ABC-type antimicrobial peptide transport system permease subunit